MNTNVDRILWYFNTLSTNPRIEFISQKLNRVVVAFNAFDLAILIDSQTLDRDLDVQDQNVQTSIDTSVDRTSTLVEVALKLQRPTLFVCWRFCILRSRVCNFQLTECQLRSTFLCIFSKLSILQFSSWLTSADRSWLNLNFDRSNINFDRDFSDFPKRCLFLCFHFGCVLNFGRPNVDFGCYCTIVQVSNSFYCFTLAVLYQPSVYQNCDNSTFTLLSSQFRIVNYSIWV